MTEEWRRTHHPAYEISNLGRVRSNARGPERILKPAPNSAGYPQVVFQGGTSQAIHKLVSEAFLGPCPKNQECRHKDGDRSNPRSDNLEYGTRSQNVFDSVRLGMWNRPTGERHGRAKLSAPQVQFIREQRHISSRSFARIYGVDKSTILSARSGKTWPHGK